MSDIITVTGNIAADPEGKRTSTGVAITTFRVASTHRRYDRENGRWVDEYTNWYSVSAFRGLADHALRSLHKGDRVVLTGRLRIRDWETSTSRGTAVEITADSIGHDLLWGTTQFQRSSSSPNTENGASGAGSPVDEWAVATVGAASDGSAGTGVESVDPTTATADWGAQMHEAIEDDGAPTDADGSARLLVAAERPF